VTEAEMKAGKRVVRNWRPRFFVHLDKKTLRLLALLLFSACWTYTALLTLPFRHGTPATNLDSSYGFGSNYFPDAGFRYGSDLIFTYGPLGYLFYPEDIGNHIVIANVVRGAIWALLLVHLVLLYRVGMNGFAKALLFMVAIIPISIPLLYHFDYYAVSVLMVLSVFPFDRTVVTINSTLLTIIPTSSVMVDDCETSISVWSAINSVNVLIFFATQPNIRATSAIIVVLQRTISLPHTIIDPTPAIVFASQMTVSEVQITISVTETVIWGEHQDPANQRVPDGRSGNNYLRTENDY